MNLIFEPTPGKPRVTQPETIPTSSDGGVASGVRRKVDALTAEKAVLEQELGQACAQAVREEHHCGTGARLAHEIDKLTRAVTQLEGRIAFYQAALDVLSP